MEELDYPDIQEAARNMRTRRHLVYLKLVSLVLRSSENHD